MYTLCGIVLSEYWLPYWLEHASHAKCLEKIGLIEEEPLIDGAGTLAEPLTIALLIPVAL